MVYVWCVNAVNNCFLHNLNTIKYIKLSACFSYIYFILYFPCIHYMKNEHVHAEHKPKFTNKSALSLIGEDMKIQHAQISQNLYLNSQHLQ